MGNFYANISLRGTTPAAVRESLLAKSRRAYITPLREGIVCVYDEVIDTQDLQELSDLTASLSSDLGCLALGVLNHDDDVLYYEVWDSGEQKDEYNSNPAYFGDSEPEEDDESLEPDEEFGPSDDEDEEEEEEEEDEDEESDESGPEGGDAFALAYAFGVPEQQSHIDELISNPDAFVFAFELHLKLCAALGIPEDFAISGFNAIQLGDMLPGLEADELEKVGF